MKPHILTTLVALPLAACATTQPGIQVQTVTVVKEVQRPCAAKPIPRPAPLPRPLPTDAVALSALLGAKLLEYAGPGKWADRTDAALAICTAPQP